MELVNSLLQLLYCLLMLRYFLLVGVFLLRILGLINVTHLVISSFGVGQFVIFVLKELVFLLEGQETLLDLIVLRYEFNPECPELL